MGTPNQPLQTGQKPDWRRDALDPQFQRTTQRNTVLRCGIQSECQRHVVYGSGT